MSGARTILCVAALAATCLRAQGTDALTVARAALADGLSELAEARCRECLADAPDANARAEACDLLMRALQAQRKWDAMEAALTPAGLCREALAREGGDRYWRAVLQFERGAFGEALATVGPVESPAGDGRYRGRAVRLAGWCLWRRNDAAGAAERFARYDALTGGALPEALPNLMDWGKTLLEVGDSGRAALAFGRLAAAGGSSPLVTEGRYQLGVSLLRSGQMGAATNVLGALAAETATPGDLRGQACLALSDAYRGMTNMAACIAILGQGLSGAQSPDVKRSLSLALGHALLDAGRAEEGVPRLQAFVSDVPADPRAAPAQMRLADALLTNRNYDGAAAAFQHYLETFGDSGEERSVALAGRGWALFGLERYAEAAEVFLKAYEVSSVASQRESCLIKAADARMANRQHLLAQELYDRALREFPASTRRDALMLQAAEAAAARGETDAAIARFRALAGDAGAGRSAADALFRIAGLEAERGAWEAARDTYGELTRRFPESPRSAEALFGRGVANYHLWRPETIGDFDRVIEKYPDTAAAESAYYMKVIGLYRLGRDVQAMVAAKAFVGRYPESSYAPQVEFWMAKAQYNAGNYIEAEEQFLAFVARHPAHAFADDALYRAGLSAGRRKEYVRSNETLARLFKEYPDSARAPEARFAQADVLTQLGKFAEAILIFDEIINRYARDELVASAWGRKGDCQFALGADDPGRYEESIAAYRVVTRMPGVRPGLALQAEYKIGRAHEKLNRADAAVEQYYARVIVPYVEMLAKREAPSESHTVWFTRAAVNAADILEAQQEWRQLVRVLDRLAAAGLPVSRDAAKRIEKIKAEHWWLFY